MTAALMDIKSTHAPKRLALAAKAGHLALSLLALTLIAVLIVVLRVFVFEYFHGDLRPLLELFRLKAGVLGL